jgi:hypothetical protein
MLPLDVEKLQHPSTPSDKQRGTRKYLLVKGILVDLIGIEPMTSSIAGAVAS